MQRTLAYPNNRLRTWLGASFSAVALVLAGCGGGGDDGSVETAAETDLELLEAAEGEVEQAQRHDPDPWRRCEQRVNNTVRKLLECVRVENVRKHQQALQNIADANNGHRASGTRGYDLSAAYAERVFRNAGYLVTRQEFQFQTFVQVSPTVLEQVAPAPGGAIDNHVLSYSGSGDVTAPVSAPSGAVTGCAPADFAGFTAGHIALISRGECTFAQKATNAHAAGAAGVVIYNNVPEDLNGTLGADFTLDIPVTGVSQAIGQQLAATAGLVLHLKTETFRGLATTSNVIAESRHGDAGKVVMVGAHLDSVNEGPGINDNGSGAAAILETAVQMAKVKPRNKVRFALWGAEESGLVGATHYVENLTQDEKDRISLYLNFDMIGSPNHVFFVYDGDDSDATGAGPGPGRSDEIEKTFERYFDWRGLPTKGTDFDGRSDYGPFMDEGIAAGGLFTGAEGVKTEEEAVLWGGTAGEAYDPCYHQACDNMQNVNLFALDVNSDAVAYATLYYAMEKERKGGKRMKQGKGKFSASKEKFHEHRGLHR